MKSFVKRKRHAKRLRRKVILLAHPVVETLVTMPTELAQKTTVFRIQNFLNDCERSAVLSYMDQSRLPAYTSNASEDIGDSGYPIHTTTYLQTKDIFETELQWLFERVRNVVHDVNISQGWGFGIGESCAFNVRVAEYHEMFKGGSLRDNKHYDCGSLITVDIMLQEANQGADFQTLENMNGEESLKRHSFRNGDALVFVSHKYHCVSKLKAGVRKVLVVEFWSGKKRDCGHRCDVPFESCTFIDS